MKNMNITLFKSVNGILKPLSNRDAWRLSDVKEVIELATMWRDHANDTVDYCFVGLGLTLSVETVYQNRQALKQGHTTLMQLLAATDWECVA